MKQSFSWWCFETRGVDDVALLRAAKEMGYLGVELITPDKFQMALDQGLRIVTHNGHGSIESGLNDLDNHDRIEREVIANLELAQKYAIPNLIVFSGNRRQGINDQEGADNTVIGLGRVAQAAEEAGVTLLIELLNSTVDHAGYMCDRTRWATDVVAAVHSPNVKVLYDIYHMQVMEGNIISSIQDNIRHIGHFHIAGVPGRHELDENQELYYPAIMRAIAATDYDGYVGQEFVTKGDPLAGLEQAYKSCNVSRLQPPNP